MYQFEIEKFNGPLDLLLQLVEQQKLGITEISISQVTDQFLSHIESLEDLDPEELSDFLVIAARLLVMKSKAILPTYEPDEEVDDLEKQLKIYKEFLDASRVLEELLKKETFSFSRSKPPFDMTIEFSPAKNMNIDNLKQSFLVVLKRLDPLVKMPRQMIERTVSLQQKIDHLKNHINKIKKIGLRELIKNAESKTEVIISFLAMLELAKQKHVTISQDKLFDDILIEKI